MTIGVYDSEKMGDVRWNADGRLKWEIGMSAKVETPPKLLLR